MTSAKRSPTAGPSVVKSMPQSMGVVTRAPFHLVVSSLPFCSVRCIRRPSMQAARGADALARHPGRVVRGEKHHDRSDVLWLSKPATERRCRYHLLGVLAAHKPDAADTLGLGVTRRHGIDPDVAGSQFLGQRQRERINRPLGRRIERRVRYRILAGDRADIDDAAAASREVLQRFLDRQDWPKDVGVEFAMEFLCCDRFERLEMKVSSEQAPRYQPWSKHLRVWTGKDEASVGESDPQRLKDASVVHQHIHRAE